MESPDFKELLLQLSNELVDDQLEKMKYLCPSIGKGVNEKITTGYQLFDVLMQRKLLSADDTKFLSKLLTDVGRQDLSGKLSKGNNNTGFDDPASAQSGPSAAETAKIDLATVVIAENLGKTWRKVARKLGLSEVKLQSIDQKPLDLDEKTMEMIWQWKKAQGSKACVEQLVVALRDCAQNLTADRVEDKMRAAT